MAVRELRTITDADRDRLLRMTERLRAVGDPFAAHLRELKSGVAEAMAVPAAHIGADVVTMNSVVRARDLESGRVEAFTLVYHGDSGMFDSRLSVLTQLGSAALGSRVGDVIEWKVARGTRRLRIEEIIYQPEAAGDFDL
jgi:regulator of nucleoside diphosphate kinase